MNNQVQSELSGLAFCRQHGLLAKTFYRRCKRLRQNGLVLAGQAFIKVQPTPDQRPTIQPGSILHYCETRLQLPTGTDPVWLAQLMNALR